jgi:hypothetical protein
MPLKLNVANKVFGRIIVQHVKGQQSAFPQHFVHVNLLQAGVAISPSVVPLLLG